MIKRYLRTPSVAERYDVTPGTIRRWIREDRFAHLNFPKPEYIGPNQPVWPEDALYAFDAARVRESVPA